MFLSIIIPAYNAGNYINQCIESCLQQDIPTSEYELIIIDDGSTDDTANILFQLAKKHTNITVYTQNNAGPSAARNLGITKATGKYIWFIDADDTIEPYSLKKICHTIKTNQLDSLCILWDLRNPNNEQLPPTPGFLPKQSKKVCSGISFLNQYAGYGLFTTVFIHKRNTIINNHIYFNEEIKMSEDSIFNINILVHTKSILVLNQIIYHYFQYNNSLANNITHKWLENQYNTIKEFIKLYQNHPSLNTYLSKYISHVTIATLIKSAKCNNKLIPSQLNTLLKQNNIYKLPYTVKKYKILVYLYNISPHLCYITIQIFYYLSIFKNNLKKWK